MVLVKDFAHAQQLFEGFISRGSTTRYTLDRMESLMAFLGNPQDAVKVIHVAGTSGKTSTAYYIATLLVENGIKVGLTVSPHIDTIAERTQINLQTIAEDEYCQELGMFLDLVEQSGIWPSYFEILVAFSFWEFHRKNVEYAVIEVGIGGLIDSTNIVHRNDKICVITDIGFDHTEILGDTLEAIAAQKAGIIQRYNQVFMHTQDEAIMQVVQKTVLQKNATLTTASAVAELQTKDTFLMLPLFQQRNFSLAYAAVKNIVPAPVDMDVALSAYIPARMEAVSWSGKTIILDGSHNEQKIAALASAFQSKYGARSTVLLVSFGENKSASLKNNLKILHSISTHIILTKFHFNKDGIRNPIEPAVIAKVAKEIGFEDIAIDDDPRKAFAMALNGDEELVLVTGSFYLLNHLRPIVQGVL